MQKTTAAAGVEHTVLPSADLPSRFPWLRLPQSEGGSDAAFTAVLEPKAGWISARGHVEAHCTLVTQRKGAVVDDAVVAVRRLRDKTPDGCLFEVDTASGDVFACEKVIVAAGGFVNARPLIPAELGEHDGDQAYQQLELQLLTAQTTRLRVTDAVGETLKEMPSLIVRFLRSSLLIRSLVPSVYALCQSLPVETSHGALRTSHSRCSLPLDVGDLTVCDTLIERTHDPLACR